MCILCLWCQACESGSMFPALPTNVSIYATTAANAEESSWGTCGNFISRACSLHHHINLLSCHTPRSIYLSAIGIIITDLLAIGIIVTDLLLLTPIAKVLHRGGCHGRWCQHWFMSRRLVLCQLDAGLAQVSLSSTYQPHRSVLCASPRHGDAVHDGDSRLYRKKSAGWHLKSRRMALYFAQ